MDEKENKVLLDEEGFPVLFLALYVKPTQTGGIRYVAFPKHYVPEKDMFIKPVSIDDTIDESFCTYFGEEAQDNIVDIAQEHNGEFPDYYIKPTTFVIKKMTKDGQLVHNKKGKLRCLIFIEDAEFIRPIPNLKVDYKNLYK